MIQAALILSYSTSKIHCEWYRDDCTKQLTIRDKVRLFVSDKSLIDKNYEVISMDADLKLQWADQLHPGKGSHFRHGLPERLPQEAGAGVPDAGQGRVREGGLSSS